MSAEKITSTRYRCKCELKDCPGKGKPWVSKDAAIPERCAYCGRRTWNGTDQRKNALITAHGRTQRLSAWSKETGLSSQLIHHRIKIGWKAEDAVTIPAGSGRKVSAT
jgi:hypothetical protein